MAVNIGHLYTKFNLSIDMAVYIIKVSKMNIIVALVDRLYTFKIK